MHGDRIVYCITPSSLGKEKYFLLQWDLYYCVAVIIQYQPGITTAIDEVIMAKCPGPGFNTTETFTVNTLLQNVTINPL